MEVNVKKYFVFNESSILISYDCPINSKLIIDLSNAKKTIMTNLNDCIIEVVQSINSLLIIFDITKISTDDIITELKKIERIERKKNNFHIKEFAKNIMFIKSTKGILT